MLTTNPLGIHPDLKQRLYFHRTGEHEVEICTAISDAYDVFLEEPCLKQHYRFDFHKSGEPGEDHFIETVHPIARTREEDKIERIARLEKQIIAIRSER
jgi:hypothetical protein